MKKTRKSKFNRIKPSLNSGRSVNLIKSLVLDSRCFYLLNPEP